MAFGFGALALGLWLWALALGFGLWFGGLGVLRLLFRVFSKPGFFRGWVV